MAYSEAQERRALDRMLDDMAALTECPAHVAREITERVQREPQYRMPPNDAAHQQAHDEESDPDRFDGRDYNE